MAQLFKSICIRWIILIFIMAPTISGAQTGYYNPVDMLQGKKKVTIPFRFIHNFIILDVKLFGIFPTELIFDTGAEHIILFKREITDVLDTPYDKRIPIMGSDLSRQIYALIARNTSVELVGLPVRTTDILVLEEDYFGLDEIIGSPVAGLIGGGFFKNLIIQIDYRKLQLTLIDPETFQPPLDFIKLPITIKTNKPYINAEASLLNGEVVQVDLLVDTGAGVPLLLHNNSHPSLQLPEQYIRGKLGMGLGGYLEGYIGRIGMLRLGIIEFPAILTSFQDIQEVWLEDQDRFRNGIVGNQLLSRFRVILDYLREQMYLKPYRARQEPFNMDRSGLVVLAYGETFNEFVVRELLEKSPGMEAGILEGDIILKIQGINTKVYKLDGINSILQRKPGKQVNLVLKRGEDVIRKSFVLRDLI